MSGSGKITFSTNEMDETSNVPPWLPALNCGKFNKSKLNVIQIDVCKVKYKHGNDT